VNFANNCLHISAFFIVFILKIIIKQSNNFNSGYSDSDKSGYVCKKEIPRQAFPTPATPFPFGKGE
jgi:hypothetical protein